MRVILTPSKSTLSCWGDESTKWVKEKKVFTVQKICDDFDGRVELKGFNDYSYKPEWLSPAPDDEMQKMKEEMLG